MTTSSLRPNEVIALRALDELGGSAELEAIQERGKLDHAAAMRAILSLSEQGLVHAREESEIILKLSEEGREYARVGLPERRLVDAALRAGGHAKIDELVVELKLSKSLIAPTLGWVKKKNWARIVKQENVPFISLEESPPTSDDEKLLKKFAGAGEAHFAQLKEDEQETAQWLERRGLVESRQKTKRLINMSEQGRKLVKAGLALYQEVSQLTPELIASGKWRDASFRKYNIKAAITPAWPGKKQPYKRFLDELKWKLVSLGFQEMVGPTVELMFFNCDALYMPQDHPAREIHDIYFVKSPQYGTVGPFRHFLPKVAETHEDGWKTGSSGWGYDYDVKESERLILRSQGTALSARTLVGKNLMVPGKYFSVVRCYRPDVVDRTHLTEFNQVEGIVVGGGLTLRDLLGVLERFAVDIAGADKVRFRPDYFPFTEPSVELQAYKKDYGWLEFGGSGIFRPELTLPLGVNVPVLAWGIGVDRLFMMRAGIDDIRQLFTHDLDWLRNQQVL